MWARLAALVLALVLAQPAGAAGHAKRKPRSTPAHAAQQVPQASGQALRGLASWYGNALHGRRTASGERYDMNEFTAAHRTLPFGTLVEVRSLVNGRTVQVRINDRGPHLARRVIDLSRAAALALGLQGRGTKPVELVVLAQGVPQAGGASPAGEDGSLPPAASPMSAEPAVQPIGAEGAAGR